MTEPITGKVAKVVSDREVIINRGSRHGVTVDMIFRIVSDEPLEVTDPDSNEVLGTVQRVKTRVQVVSTDENFCIARTFRTRRVNVGGLDALGTSRISKMFEPPKYEVQTETLRINPDEVMSVGKGPLVVQVGDRVIEAQEGDEAEVQTIGTEFR